MKKNDLKMSQKSHKIIYKKNKKSKKIRKRFNGSDSGLTGAPARGADRILLTGRIFARRLANR